MSISMLKIKDKKKTCVYTLSFALPFLCMFVIYIILKVYPFGNNTVLVSDMNIQYVELFGFLHRVLIGKESIIYSFTKEMGANAFGMFAYYLSSPFSLLAAFFSQEKMPICIFIIAMLKIGTAGLTFAVFITNASKKCDLTTVLFSCSYALATYPLFYSMNIMWLDGVVWLPIVLLGIERVLDKKSPVVFIFAFTAALYSNYYTAYMTAIFTVIYFLFRYFSSDENKSAKDFFKKMRILAVAALICTLLAAPILVPTLISMLDGKFAVDLNEPSNFWNENIFEIPRRLFVGQYDSIFNNGAPSIFCGTLCGTLVLIWFLNPKIKIREKLASFLVFAVLFVSFFVREIDEVWHVFHWPTGFPYRYAYVFCFFAVYVAARSFYSLKRDDYLWIAAGTVLYLLILIAVFIFDRTVIKNTVFAIVTFVLIFIGGVWIFAEKHIGKKHRFFTICAMLTVACVEMTTNGYVMINGLYKTFSTADYSSYSEFVGKLKSAVDYITDYDEDFYRFEKTYSRSGFNENMSCGIRGATSYTSTFNSNIFNFFDALGMRRVGVSAKYHGSTMLTDSILDFRYIITKPNTKINDNYELIKRDDTNSIYKNPYVLGIGLAASNKALSALPNENTVFDNQNKLSTILLEGDNIFKDIHAAEPADNGMAVEFKANENGAYYIDLGQYYRGDLNAEVNGIKRSYNYDFGEEKRVYYIGKLGRNDTVKISFSDKQLSRNVMAAMIDMTALKNGTDGIKTESRLNITDYGNTWLEGDIILDDEEVIFTSIPYEKGWTAYVDGEKTEFFKAFDTFIAVPAGAGNHQIKLKFHAPGLRISFAVSLITLLALIAFANKEKIKAFVLRRTKGEIK